MPVVPFVAPELIRILSDLVQEPVLPLLDRWFARTSSKENFRDSGKLWESLRLCVLLSEAYLRTMEPDLSAANRPLSWTQARDLLLKRLTGWASFAAASQTAEVQADPLRWGIPAWLKSEWRRRTELSGWGDDVIVEFLRFQVRPPGLHLRFAEGESAERARRAWLESGGELVEIVPGVWSAHGRSSVFTTDAWKKGEVEIQDAASFTAARSVGARPGHAVWDVCAGRGGKTTALAAEMHGKGSLWATDVAENKLADLKRRVARSGWQNVRTQVWDGKLVPDFPLEAVRKGGFDRVLVDAPCSASGTWRRDPDARFRLDPGVLKTLEEKQDGLLRMAWQAVRPGGSLTYVTCSWLPCENEDRANAFEKATGKTAVRKRLEILGLPSFDANTMFLVQWEKLP